MFDLDRWQEIFHVLKKNKLRTFLTAFGVFWGIFMLVIMLGSGNGLENGVTQNFGDMATNSVFLWPQQTSISYKGFPRGRRFNFDDEDTKAFRKSIPEIKYLAPRLQAGGFMQANNVVRGKKTGVFSLMGDYPEFNLIDPLNLQKGRFINDIDIKDKRKVVVIGSRAKDILFTKDEDPINQYIKIQGIYFQVIGQFISKRNGENAEQENQTIYMPFTTMQRTFNYGNAVGFYSVTSRDNIPVSVVEDKAIRLLKKQHSVSPVDETAIGHFNLEKEFDQMQGLFGGIRGLVWLVGIGTLLAGIIGVSNIMLVVVRERTKEIGIQRALGASPWNVISGIITESVVLTTFAGYTGLVIGVGLLEMINYLLVKSGAKTEMFLHPGINFNVAVMALTILIISGAFAGFIPAKRAVSIKPIDALRFE
ncbi:MAG: ABC transporter permease [Bacteroidetes bacterium]|nr:ABC transporter permease [Bacteroidota bacterium]